MVSKLTPTSIGMFTIWKFMNLPRFHWALVDLEAEQYALFAKLGVQQIDLRGLKSSNTWQPSSYDLPVDKIADEAIADVNDKLRRFVFPKLEVDFEN